MPISAKSCRQFVIPIVHHFIWRKKRKSACSEYLYWRKKMKMAHYSINWIQCLVIWRQDRNCKKTNSFYTKYKLEPYRNLGFKTDFLILIFKPHYKLTIQQTPTVFTPIFVLFFPSAHTLICISIWLTWWTNARAGSYWPIASLQSMTSSLITSFMRLPS